MTCYLALEREAILDAVEDNGKELVIRILRTYVVGNLVRSDESRPVEIRFNSPSLYLVMDEVFAAQIGLKAERYGDVLFTVDNTEIAAFFKWNDLYQSLELRSFLLVTSHSVLLILADNEPHVIESARIEQRQNLQPVN